MSSLELKIPPLLVAVVSAFIMWGIFLVTPVLQTSAATRVVAAILIALIGGCVSLAGVISFRRMKTTINPTKPERASLLVICGVFKITRNPMYLGIMLALVAWAIFLSSPWALLGPLAFALYINRFQIAPEERALDVLFGSEYAAYKARVRRWI
jgi:protein-S-isoprenylcysteine O-methyltransferase Ste14